MPVVLCGRENGGRTLADGVREVCAEGHWLTVLEKYVLKDVG